MFEYAVTELILYEGVHACDVLVLMCAYVCMCV